MITGINWQKNGKESFFYKSGTFLWHIVSKDTPDVKNSFNYETITTPGSIDQFFPDVNGNDITLQIYNESGNKNDLISFSNVKGKFNIDSGDSIVNDFEFTNVSKLTLIFTNKNILNHVSVYGSHADFTSRIQNISDSIVASFINYKNYIVPNLKDTCKVSFISVYDLYNNSTNFINAVRSNTNNSLYDENMFVRNTDKINEFITGEQTQHVFITNSSSILINNATKYSLIRHSHKNIFNYEGNVAGVTLNTVAVEALSDNISTGVRTVNNNINYEETIELGLRRSLMNPIPLGTVMGWYQVNGKPKVPYGFYDLTSNSEFHENGKIRIYIDGDDPSANSYNLDFMTLYKDKGVFSSGYIEFTAQPIITVGNVRILTIIKYNHNVTYRIE